MADEEVSKRVIEPLDPTKHDRAAFSYGIGQVDNFFKKTANKLSKADNLRVYVMTDDDGKTVIGFYAINTHSIHVATPRKPSAGSLSIPDTVSSLWHRIRCACSCQSGRSSGS